MTIVFIIIAFAAGLLLGYETGKPQPYKRRPMDPQDELRHRKIQTFILTHKRPLRDGEYAKIWSGEIEVEALPREVAYKVHTGINPNFNPRKTGNEENDHRLQLSGR